MSSVPAATGSKRLSILYATAILGALPISLRLACFRWIFSRRCPAPKTFNDRLRWNLMQRYDERLSRTSDKIAVREYVAEKVGAKYLSEIYGIYRNSAEIPFQSLPKKYVLKANHGSGWNVFVDEGSRINQDEIRARCGKWLSQAYSRHAEWWYGEIKPALLAEEFLDGPNGGVPNDYKFFVFRGRVELVQVDASRFTGHKRNLYEPDWIPLESSFLYPRGEETPRPAAFDEMKWVAETLGREFDFVRVDLYSVGDRVVFGEMTHFPECGQAEFSSPELNARMARRLQEAIAHR